jgi:hypothetical protein
VTREEKEQFWLKHYEHFKISNLSKSEYCRQHLLNVSNFKNWTLKFQNQEKSIVNIQMNPSSPPPTMKKKSFIPIEIENSKKEISLSSRDESVLKVQIGKMVLEFSRLPDPLWLFKLSSEGGNGELSC